jgi:hypothetical protein
LLPELTRECQTTIDQRLVAEGLAVPGHPCPECGSLFGIYTYRPRNGQPVVRYYECCFSLCRHWRKGDQWHVIKTDEVCDHCDHCDDHCDCEHCDYDGEKAATVCDNCNACENHCDCDHCRSCGDAVNEVCESCAYCEGCCDCVTCESCQERTSYTQTVGGSEWCEGCCDSYASYCDECEEYYPDDDSHSHDCDCAVPEPEFQFPADGHGTIGNDERFTVELPKGTIDDEGLRRITYLVQDELRENIWENNWYVPDVISEVGPTWQTRRGNFTRRLSSALHKHGVKLSPATISEIGNIARQHSSGEATWHIEFTRDLNQPADYFYHDDSCWWQSYHESRCCLKSWGGLGIRSFRNADSNAWSPTGRAWIQPLDENLEATHDTLGAHAYVVYNGYGDIDGYIAARIVAHLTGRSYRKVGFVAGVQYINNGGFLVADEATCAATDNIRLNYDRHDHRDAAPRRAA